MIIPTGYSYTCTIEGCSFKIVQCEYCQFVYVYKMTRSAVGSISAGFSDSADVASRHARSVAYSQLNQKLSEDCDAIPCLDCGKFQEHMVEALRRDFMLGAYYFSFFFLILGSIGLVVSWLAGKAPTITSSTQIWLWVMSVTLLGLGISMLVWRNVRKRNYEPNSTDLSERFKIADRYARTLDEFKEYLKLHGTDLEGLEK